MEYIGKGIGTLGLATMVVGVAHFAPSAVVCAGSVAGVINFFMWGN